LRPTLSSGLPFSGIGLCSLKNALADVITRRKIRRIERYRA
jgi:hypothetical protein